MYVQVSVAEYKGPYTESAKMFCSCCVPAVRFSPGCSFSSNPTACFDPTHPQLSKGKPPLSSSCQPNQQCVEVSQTHFNWSCSLSPSPLHAHQTKTLTEDVQPWLEHSGVSVARHGGLLHFGPELARCNSNSRAAAFPRRSSSDRRRRWRRNVG